MGEDLCVGDLLNTVNHLLLLADRVSQETVILEKGDNEAIGGRKHITFPGSSHQVKKWLVFQVTALRGQIFVLLFWKYWRPFKGHWSATDSSHDSRIFLHRWMNIFWDFVRSQRALILRMFCTSKIFGIYLRKTRKLRHFWQNLCARSKAIDPTVEDLFHIMIGNWFNC